MKKIAFITLILIVFSVPFFACALDKGEEEIHFYYFDFWEMQELLTSMDIEEIMSEMEYMGFRNLEGNDIERFFITKYISPWDPGKPQWEEDSDISPYGYAFWIDGLAITKNGITMLSDYNTFDQMLTEHGINEKTVDVKFFNAYQESMNAFVKTNENMYWICITYDIQSVPQPDTLPTQKFEIVDAIVHTLEEFKETYRLKPGTISVMDIEYPTDIPVLFYEDTCLIPLRSVIEALGGMVNWDDETRKTTFDYNHESYLCDYSLEGKLFERIKIWSKKMPNDYVQIQYYGQDSGPGYCCMLDDRTYMQKNMGEALLKRLGVKFEIDCTAKELKMYLY